MNSIPPGQRVYEPVPRNLSQNRDTHRCITSVAEWRPALHTVSTYDVPYQLK
jgi:hypothetical protein